MRTRRLRALASYEVIGVPVVGADAAHATVPWIDQAVAPYAVTQLPQCTVVGLWDALRSAEAKAS